MTEKSRKDVIEMPIEQWFQKPSEEELLVYASTFAMIQRHDKDLQPHSFDDNLRSQSDIDPKIRGSTEQVILQQNDDKKRKQIYEQFGGLTKKIKSSTEQDREEIVLRSQNDLEILSSAK